MVATATEEFLSPEEVGERLGVSVYTVRRWAKTGQLRAFRPGKEYRIQESDLEEFLRAREVRPKAPSRSPAEPTFNDVLGAERRLRYLRGWRAFAGDLFLQWSQEQPTSDEIRPFVVAMNALVDQGVFEPSGLTDPAELDNISVFMQLLRKLNDIADHVEEDETAQQRRELLEAISGELSA